MFIKKIAVLPLAVFILAGCSSSYSSSKKTTMDTDGTETTLQSGRECINNFTILQKVDSEQFAVYRKQFDAINKTYEFYSQNAAIMDKDQKQLITMESNSKLNLICARVKNAAYAGVEKKMRFIAEL